MKRTFIAAATLSLVICAPAFAQTASSQKALLDWQKSVVQQAQMQARAKNWAQSEALCKQVLNNIGSANIDKSLYGMFAENQLLYVYRESHQWDKAIALMNDRIKRYTTVYGAQSQNVKNAEKQLSDIKAKAGKK